MPGPDKWERSGHGSQDARPGAGRERGGAGARVGGGPGGRGQRSEPRRAAAAAAVRAACRWPGSPPPPRFAPAAHAAVCSVDGTFPDSPAERSSAPPALDAMFRRSFNRFVSTRAAALHAGQCAGPVRPSLRRGQFSAEIGASVGDTAFEYSLKYAAPAGSRGGRQVGLRGHHSPRPHLHQPGPFKLCFLGPLQTQPETSGWGA